MRHPPLLQKGDARRVFEHLLVDGEKRTAFLHAKFYGFRRGDQALVFAGSANCSPAALTESGAAGNAELMAVRRMPVTDFETALVGELVRVPEPVALAEYAPENDDVVSATGLRVLAARLDAGGLLRGSPLRVPIFARARSTAPMFDSRSPSPAC